MIAPGVDDIQISRLEHNDDGSGAARRSEIEERQINGDRTTSEQVLVVVSED